jgi:outer membrane autotransporter protein
VVAGALAGVFLKPFGMTAKQGATDGRTPYGSNTWGVLGGVDLALSEHLAAGIFGGYTRRDIALGAPASDSGHADTASLGLFATRYGRNWFVEGSARFGLDAYQARRAVSLPTGSFKVGSSWTGWNLFANIGAGYDWRAGGFAFGPIGSLDYGLIAQNGYDEYGGGPLGLRVKARLDGSLQTLLGARVARPIELSFGRLTPEVRVLWGHEWLGGSRSIEANFRGFENASFTTKTVPQGTDWAAVSAAVTLECSKSFSLTARVSTDLFRRDYQTLAGSLSLRFNF